MTEADPDSVTWLYRALAATVAIGGSLLGLIWKQVHSVRDEMRDEVGSIRSRMMQQDDGASRARLADARTYATKDDMAQLKEHIDRVVGDLRRDIMSAILNRGPVRGGEL